jgi:hypothetical protein
MTQPDIILTRPASMCTDLIVVDGIPGCGKTMLSAIVGTLERVELLKYSYEIEMYSFMAHFSLLSSNSASEMIRYQLDLMIYNLMMGRDLNFRYSDLSSVFNAQNKLRYFKRLFAKGDEVIPERIEKEKPILHLATHSLSAFANPMMDVFTDGMLLINLHRHPLYMLKQNMWNMENLINNKRHFEFNYQWNQMSVPYFFHGQEERMIAANAKEKAIYFMEWLRMRYNENKLRVDGKKYYELTFESFVLDPYPHINKICEFLNTKQGKHTSQTMKREKIPRTLLTHGRDISIYRRVNWSKTDSASNDDETMQLYNWACEGISDEAIQSLNWLIQDYHLIVERLK